MKNTSIVLAILFLLFLPVFNIYAQDTSSVHGVVKMESGEKLSGVNIILLKTNYGTSTNQDGNFQLEKIPEGSYVLEASYMGFTTITKNISVRKNKTLFLEIELQESEYILDEVYVKGATLKSKNSSATVNVIKASEIRNLVVEQPLRLLEQVTGVNVVAYGQGGVADQFSMRGFGGGGHAGEAGVEIDGVSLNEAEGHSDGYADLNVLIPLNLSKVKVYKGPSSALFGRFAQGGTIALETRRGGEYHDFAIRGGSYGTLDAQYAQGSGIKLKNSGKELQTNFALQLFTTEGYHEHSDILKGNISGRLSYPLTEKSEIAISLRGHRSEWNAPGYITKEQYENEELRNKPAPTAENDGGNKTFFSQRVDYNFKVSNNIKLLLFGYALQQDFTRYAKFGYTPTGQSERYNTRNVFAFGGSLNGNTKLANKNLDWITGLEFYNESTDRKRWNTAYRKRQDLYLKRYFDVQSFSLYIQGELELHKLFKPTIGLRYDAFGGDYKNNDLGVVSTQGKIKNLYHISPKIGFRSTLANSFDFRANVSNGYSLPNGSRKYDEVSDFEPTELWQFEAGFSYNNNEWLNVDITGFVLNSNNEIIERPIGSGTYVNAGETKRTGIETDALIHATEGLTFKGTFTFTETEVIEGPNKGKSLTQIPTTITTLGTTYTSPIGLGTDISYRNVADYYTNDDNSFKGGGYSITNLTLFYNFNKLLSNKGRMFFTVNNLFDKKYAETIFGTNTYAASPTRNVSFGVNYSF